MSEQSEQNAPERCSCCTCGYTWVKGQYGGHSCAQVMEVTLADLRARLAKYEDAEGNPIAQPSGVVLPDHERAKLVNALRDCAKTYSGTDQLRAQIATVLGQFIPLNSSPARAGDDDDQAYDAEAERLTAEALGTGAGINPNATSIDDIFLTESAGGVDERATSAFEALIEEHITLLGFTNETARAAQLALSAPSHGEQVRELPPFAQKVISKLKRFEECASDSDAGGVDIGRHWLDLLTQLGLLNRVQRSPGLWEISQQGEDVLAAAPSAGSQEQG